MSNITKWEASINSYRPDFEKALVDTAINFDRESFFAYEILSANSFLAGVAEKNPSSLKTAFLNTAAFGISLSTAQNLAYLVPRGGRVCLDISYKGLMHIAQQSGAIERCEAFIVRENDEFEVSDLTKPPRHKYSPFASAEKRGKIVGVYCIVKTGGGDFMTHCMSIEQIDNIKQRSEAGKKGTGPWKTDFEEMVKKTCVKQASKYWPRKGRFDDALKYMNTEGGEGIDFTENQSKTLNPDEIKERGGLVLELLQAADLKAAWENLNLDQKALVGREFLDLIKKGINPLADPENFGGGDEIFEAEFSEINPEPKRLKTLTDGQVVDLCVLIIDGKQDFEKMSKAYDLTEDQKNYMIESLTPGGFIK